METELFPCLVDMKFPRGEGRRSQQLIQLKKELIAKKKPSYYPKSEKRNQDRYSDMGCTINRTSF